MNRKEYEIANTITKILYDRLTQVSKNGVLFVFDLIKITYGKNMQGEPEVRVDIKLAHDERALRRFATTYQRDIPLSEYEAPDGYKIHKIAKIIGSDYIFKLRQERAKQ